VIPHKARLLKVKNLQSSIFTRREKPLIVVLESYSCDVTCMAFKHIFISELFWSQIKHLYYIMSGDCKVLAIIRKSHLINLCASELDGVLGEATGSVPKADSMIISSRSEY